MRDHINIEKLENCCGCAACVNACPTDAMRMCEDNFGYVYPNVDEEKCIKCGRCSEICSFTLSRKGENPCSNIYIGRCKNKEALEESSSGGIFSALAESVLKCNGVVFGAAWNKDGLVEHICVKSKEDLVKLRGSKYVQSNIGIIYREVKKFLGVSVPVCFVGTPCQISGLKSYLGRPYEQLLTIDIVCHGVPSQKLLGEDLKYISQKYKINPALVKFRDKKWGWGTKGSVSDGNKTIKYNAINSPYYFYFLRGELYRPSCYNCRFPSEGRQGDVTIGDYWAVDASEEQKLGDARKGISCILVNTEKGKQWIEKSMVTLQIIPSTIERISVKNGQLVECSKPTNEHVDLMKGYKNKGYASIVEKFEKKKKDRILLQIKSMIPSKIKRIVASFH